MSDFKNNLLEKYSRQMIIDEIGVDGQKKICDSSISIIGCGGLGTSAAQYLSMSGVGSFKLIDNDKIILSNLNRQTLFTEKDVGKKKSFVLASKICEINSSAKVEKIENKVTKRNINSFLKDSDIILDCTDNFESRLLINKFCHNNKKILISAALQSFDIQVFMFASWMKIENPCYKCIFPDLFNDKNASCDEMGIISPVAGLGGLLQANLALNYILELRQNFKEFLLFDTVNLNLKKISVKKNIKCEICN